MKLCLLSVAPAGDDLAGAIAQYPARLAAHDALDVTLALAEVPPGPQVAGLPARAVGELTGERFDVALALTWRAVARLFEIEADRYALYVPTLEHLSLADAEPTRVLALVALDLPVDLIAGSAAVAAALRELRPEARVFEVPAGWDPARSVAAADVAHEVRGGPLRVLVDPGVTAGQVGFAATAAMTAEREVDALEPGEARAARARRYAGADVLVVLDEDDGSRRSVFEAMAAGVPVVAGPIEDAAGLLRDGENVLILPGGDAAGAAGALDRLASDRAALGALMAAVRASAAQLPTWEQSTAGLVAALEQILAEQPPAAAMLPRRLMADLDAAVTLFQLQLKSSLEAQRRLERDSIVRAGLALRTAYRSPRLGVLRRAAGPMVVRARRRRAGDE